MNYKGTKISLWVELFLYSHPHFLAHEYFPNYNRMKRKSVTFMNKLLLFAGTSFVSNCFIVWESLLKTGWIRKLFAIKLKGKSTRNYFTSKIAST